VRRPACYIHERQGFDAHTGIAFTRRTCSSLRGYDATTHFVGQSTILSLTTERATGDAYRLAHYVAVDDGKRRLMLASLRYLDTFVKMDGSWLFAKRRLYVEWLERRAFMTAAQVKQCAL
jgi:SnoaL-like protein